MRERVEAERDLIESGEYHRWLSVMNSHHEYVREIFDFMPRESDEDWANVRQRLAAVPDALDKLRASFMYAADEGKVAARRQALACAGQCEVWGQPDGAFGELATESEAMDLTVEAGQAARAFLEFGQWLRNDYAAMATAHDPVGPERYRLFARFHNGTDLDLDETYQWGWDELHGIELRMAELVERISPGIPRRVHRSVEDGSSLHGRGRRQLRRLEPGRDRSDDRRSRRQVLRDRPTATTMSVHGGSGRRAQHDVLHATERGLQPAGSDLAPGRRERPTSRCGRHCRSCTTRARPAIISNSRR